jgi:hypothetical protein
MLQCLQAAPIINSSSCHKIVVFNRTLGKILMEHHTLQFFASCDMQSSLRWCSQATHMPNKIIVCFEGGGRGRCGCAAGGWMIKYEGAVKADYDCLK